MAQNKNALIRYKTIDRCLQNKYREWTLEDLIEACNEALYEYEGRDVNVSRRSVQLDIQWMRSDKLGYNAPISVYNKKYYRYDDENYSITNVPLNESDMQVLSESVEVLKQFRDFSLFSELGGIIQRLEDKVYAEKSQRNSIIHLDKNEKLKGLEHLDVLYQSILKKLCINISYQSFKAKSSSEFVFHPYILKEYNNRWFLVGRRNGNTQIITLALDRMVHINYNLAVPYEIKDFDADFYYRNTVGVTVLPDSQVQEIHLKVDRTNAPYVITKPFHSSQTLISKDRDGSIIVRLNVHINYEFERLILGFGESVEVLKPKRLRKRIRNKLLTALDQYELSGSKN